MAVSNIVELKKRRAGYHPPDFAKSEEIVIIHGRSIMLSGKKCGLIARMDLREAKARISCLWPTSLARSPTFQQVHGYHSECS